MNDEWSAKFLKTESKGC